LLRGVFSLGGREAEPTRRAPDDVEVIAEEPRQPFAGGLYPIRNARGNQLHPGRIAARAGFDHGVHAAPSEIPADGIQAGIW